MLKIVFIQHTEKQKALRMNTFYEFYEFRNGNFITFQLQSNYVKM